MRFKLVFAIAMLLPGTAAWAQSEPAWERFGINLEAGAVWFSRNDIRIPGDTGTEFDMTKLTGTGPEAFFRLGGHWDINEKHGLVAVLDDLGPAHIDAFDAHGARV